MTTALPQDLSTLLKQHGQLRTFAEGETLVRLGDPMPFVPVVLKGSIRILTEDSEGREMLLYYLRPGESCVATLLSGEPLSTVKAVAEENTDVVFINRELARNWVLHNPTWNAFVLSLYQKRMDELLQTVNEIAFRKVDERLVEALRKHAAHSGSAILYLTHQQLADELGTAREVVSRLLKKLEIDGRIELQRGKIKLTGL
ncbi:Crp/Fnr family transcriptional regulator [Tellurirhabdus rosea]|uniref:Crp/Fnr family transcriptional regulator n=1 Tax=Tellurirhabdus rosea TaxID=2674997 RepID=UPI0022549B8D|nr:Crp/Fnr family transcriptional regulator [Tellurirhabdus rosea]